MKYQYLNYGKLSVVFNSPHGQWLRGRKKSDQDNNIDLYSSAEVALFLARSLEGDICSVESNVFIQHVANGKFRRLSLNTEESLQAVAKALSQLWSEAAESSEAWTVKRLEKLRETQAEAEAEETAEETAEPAESK